MTPPAAPNGLYGKLPCRGDFLVRDLPGSFLAGFEPWLQAGVAAAADRAGATWPEAFLAGPALHLSVPATRGLAAWQAVLLPSRDAIGRAFPIVYLRVEVKAEHRRPPETPDMERWFQEVTGLLRSAVDTGADPDALLATLHQVPSGLVNAPRRRFAALWPSARGDTSSVAGNSARVRRDGSGWESPPLPSRPRRPRLMRQSLAEVLPAGWLGQHLANDPPAAGTP